MPAKWFICPDGAQTEITQCLEEGGCRRNNRCATRNYLRLVAKERPWTGKPSTTQLINGTMVAYLRLIQDFAISPGDRSFMLHGTKVHKALEVDDEYTITEERFDGDDTAVTGIMDVLEVENGKSVLVDYKTAGSYKVQKALGWYTETEETDGTYKSGPRKGQPRTRKVLKQSDSMIDRWEWELQLNKYRLEMEKRGFPVDDMRIMCIVRDGNTHIARGRGVMRNIYYFRINRLPDDEVKAYFNRKRIALLFALKHGWSKPCTPEENWGGIRCGRYCEVAEFCPLGKYLKKEKEVIQMPIKGISEKRWMPRDGKIRLGIMKKSAKGTEYPSEIDYFRLDPVAANEDKREELISKFHELYGKEPKSIEIMFPTGEKLADGDWAVFPQNFARYGKGSGLKCKGDGETAVCMSPDFAKGLKVIETKDGLPVVECKGKECPYQQNKECTRHATLQVFLPRLKGAGVWQINTSSWNSIVNINSDLEHLINVIGRFHMLYKASSDTYLRLQRVPTQTTYEGKAATHYALKIDLGIALSDLTYMAKLEAAEVMAALPPADAEEATFDDVPEETIHNEPVQELPPKPEPKTNGNGKGLTFESLVSGVAMRMDVDEIVFSTFALETYGNKGKATMQLKAAAEDDGKLKELNAKYSTWVATLDGKINSPEPVIMITPDQQVSLVELVKTTPMKSIDSNDFKQWVTGVLGVEYTKLEDLTQEQGAELVSTLDDGQETMEL